MVTVSGDSSMPYRTTGLGDRIEQSLTRIGITKDRVEEWVGGPCGCESRRIRINAIEFWVRQFANQCIIKARRALHTLMSEE